jgi:hypothetical protein
MAAGTRSLPAVVAGTGFEGRASIIRNHCREGAPVRLKREPSNPHDSDAIAVWMECSSFFGLFKSWRQIGYIKASRASGLAQKLDAGKLTIQRTVVRSFHAPRDLDHPRVSLLIELTETA